MDSLRHFIRAALLCVLVVTVCLQARAAVAFTALDRSRLANIKRIADAKSEGTQWRTLLAYLSTGPSTKVRLESAGFLSRVQRPTQDGACGDCLE